MSNVPLTRITPEAAENDKAPLFTNGAAPATKFTVSVQMDGFPVTVEFTGNSRKLQEVIGALKTAGATPPPVKSFGGGGFKKPDDRTEPAYDGNGDPICPVHGKRLSIRDWNGQQFYSCPAKAAAGEKASPKGYCDIRFKRPQ